MTRRTLTALLLLPFAAAADAQPAVYAVEDAAPRYTNARTGGNYMYNFYLPPPGTASPWWPSWSPDGQHLAFSMQGTIWKIRPGETKASELVHEPEYLSSPEWSPGGRYIAYTSDNGSSINLRLLDLDTGQSTPLTEGDFVNLDPAWSPDGRQLAFVSTSPNGYFNVFVREMASGETLRVTDDHSFGRSRLYFGDIDLHIQPAWLPSGDTLLVVSNRGIPLGSGGVWRLPVAPNAMERATLIHREETLYRTRPSVSPDGKRFVYSSHLGGQFNGLFVLPTVGGEPYRMSFGDHDDFHPRFSPDGETIAYVSNRDGLPQLRLLETYGGRDRAVTIESLDWMVPTGTLTVRIIDVDTGETLPARIYNRASDGKTYVPRDAYHRQGRLAEHFFHTGGTFTLEVPSGDVTVEAMHGFEYYPAALTTTVEAGETMDTTLALQRMTNLQGVNWYSGSNHVHMNYGGNLRNTPENLVFMAAAEHLHVIGELIANKDNRVLDWQYFTGEPHPLTDENHVLFFNEEYRPPFYGHVSFINLTEHLISPFTTGYEGTAIESLYPSNTQMFALARKQGALGAYVHPFWGTDDPLDTNLGVAKAFPVDLALGMLDYHELVSGANWAAYLVWHHALNCGFSIPAVGGEDSISDLHRTAIVGQMRAYAHMEGGLSWDGWLDAIREGKLFVTNGPLLELTVNDKMIGSTIDLGESGGPVTVRGSIRSVVPVDHAKLVINGERVRLGTPGTAFAFEREIEITKSSWITLEAHTDGAVHPIDDRFVQATTNPIWVNVGNRGVRSAASADYFMRWIDKLTAMAESHPGWRSEREKEHVLSEFGRARDVYVDLWNEANDR